MSEFADEWPKEKLQEFTKHDVNDDGVITARELGQTGADADGYFSNANAEILPPRSTIVSEIEIDDETTISDLNLELSITHTYVGHLDAYLIGPDGQRIELFTEIGRDGDHFEDTVFDDDSKTNINKQLKVFHANINYKWKKLVNKKNQ